MRTRQAVMSRAVLALLCGLALALPMAAQSEIPAGTRFLVELRDNLEARKVRPGKKFQARTLEALYGSDGRWIEAGAKLKGRVASVDGNRILLRFEQLDTRRGWVPIVATVTGVVGEKHVKKTASDEGEIRGSSDRGRNAAIGGAVGAGVGAAIGATQGGGRGAAIGAIVGGGTGAVLGAASGRRELRLREGTRIEVQLDRPVLFRPKN